MENSKVQRGEPRNLGRHPSARGGKISETRGLQSYLERQGQILSGGALEKPKRKLEKLVGPSSTLRRGAGEKERAGPEATDAPPTETFDDFHQENLDRQGRNL